MICGASQNRFRHLGLMLVAMALALRVLIPGGFMVAAPSDGALPTLVICTGHGPLILDQSGAPVKTAPSKPGHDNSNDHPCTFAGGMVGLGAAVASELSLPVDFAFVAVPAVVLRDQQPGRGLAAPPPPTTGPPIIS